MHWYRRDTGLPCYTIVGKNGKKRAPTLRDARNGVADLPANAIVPSVTTILYDWGTPPGLVNWQLRNLAAMGARLPLEFGETEPQYADRLLRVADEERKAAMQLGSDVHHTAEALLADAPLLDVSPEARACADAAVEWIRAELSKVHLVERSFAAGLYGGKFDLLGAFKGRGGVVLLDFKTQKTKTDAKGGTRWAHYDEWGEQLAAYADAFKLRNVEPKLSPRPKRWGNLIISTAEPGKVYYHEWEDKARMRAQWLCKLRYFQQTKDWFPEQEAA